MFKFYLKILKIIIFFLFLSNKSYAQNFIDIEVLGNERITAETIILFSEANKNTDISEDNLNKILKNLFDTNFFSDVSLEIKDKILLINVVEQPLIQSVNISGIKAKRIIKSIKDVITLKDRSSYNSILLKQDIERILEALQNQGYYFSKVNTSITDLEENKININYDIDLGKKSKIKKITFTGNKIFKDRKLRGLIVSEEYKFWKFISGRKYLNAEVIKFDEDLLKNFYLNQGYFDIQINSSFAKLLSENEFELVFNIQANEKHFFDNLDIKMSDDYDNENFIKIFNLFENLKGEPYSINAIDNILERIDEIIISEQFESIQSKVNQIVKGNKINLLFEIEETEKFFVERINIFGNNITDEKVIRNQLEIDEGDPFNEILQKKSINNLKSLNYFKTVNSEIVNSENNIDKIINITVEEKPTGEIMAGAGVGTSGSTMVFGVKENNFLGRGIGLNTQLKVSEEDIKGTFSVTNKNFRNSDKDIYFTLDATEIDKLTDSGYKTNKSGFKIGTKFEYFDDLKLGLGTSNYYEKISTNSSASTRQQQQEGHYWDSFLNLDVIQDKRNQRFQTTRGYISRYNVDLPVLSDTNSFINQYSYKYFTELYDENISSIGFTLGAAFSLDHNDIKLSERLYIPSGRLRGFETGKVGPKDGNDFIGGNYMATLNINTTIPQLSPNSQNIDTVIFIDVANLWGVDYDSSIDGESIVKSSIGLGLDWFTPIGPLSFSLAQPITKDTKDITETFRFNIGTSF